MGVVDGDVQATRIVAEGILHTMLGAVEALDASPGMQALRCSMVEGSSDTPTTVIVKRVARDGDPYDPDAPDGPAWWLFNDWAGLSFLDHLAGEHSPAARFYGGDRRAGLLVLEDLGADAHLDTLLLGHDPVAAEEALRRLAATLGRMHALTIDKEEEYHRVRAALGPANPRAYDGRYDWIAPTIRTMAATMGVATPAHLDDDLTLLTVRLSDPAPFLAYIHGDACPDNCVHSGDTVRLFDFEHGRFGPALIDGVYGRLPFPSCWCIGRLPERVARDMEDTYRAALAHGCPAATDDTLFYRAVVEACVYWLAHFARLNLLTALLERDSLWDTATLRQRFLQRLDAVDRALQEVAYLEAIGALTATIAANLHALWDPTTQPMPYYPAFQGSR